jgi:hypothetical protein
MTHLTCGLRTRILSTFGMCFSFLFVFLACGGSPSVSPQPGAVAPDFTLSDQYDTSVQLQQFRGRNVLLLGCGQNHLGIGRTWLSLLRERYADDLQVLPIADGSRFSFFIKLFLKSKIKSELRQDHPPSILLDWSGDVSRRYGMHPEKCNAVLIDPDGHIRSIRVLEEPDDMAQQSLFNLIDAQIYPAR